MNRQHARQYDARDVEVAMIEAEWPLHWWRSLHRNVTLNVGNAPQSVLQHSDVGQNERIGAQLSLTTISTARCQRRSRQDERRYWRYAAYDGADAQS